MLLAPLLPYLKLVRVGALFSPAADVTAGLCLAGLPWSADAGRAVAASVLVYAAGMVLNDHADRHRDAELRPERPLPRGQIGPATALTIGVAMMAAALLLAPAPLYHGVLIALVVLYNYLSKASVALGALNMGALRGLNLAAGAVALGAPADRTILIAAGCYSVYIVAVTLLGVLEDARVVARRAVISLQTVPPLCAGLALLGMPEPWPAAAIGGVLALLFLGRLGRVAHWDPVSIRASMTWLLLGTMLYTGLLCLSAGRWPEWLAIWATVLPARWISRRIAMT